MSKYGLFSGPYFRVFGLNTKIYRVNLRIQSEYRKIRIRKNSVFGHFSGSGNNSNQILFSYCFYSTYCNNVIKKREKKKWIQKQGKRDCAITNFASAVIKGVFDLYQSYWPSQSKLLSFIWFFALNSLDWISLHEINTIVTIIYKYNNTTVNALMFSHRIFASVNAWLT